MKQINFYFLFIIGILSSFSQEIEVTGTISDTNGNVIPSVNVKAIGTTKGVQSDFDGIYKISVEKGKKLEFSYVGMKTTTKVVEGNKLDIILQDDLLGLDEVVITGTSGVAKKRQLGSSISSVTAKDLSAAKANVSMGEALQGQIAGAKINRNSGDPSGGMSITLRGSGSVSGSSDPLIIIDGVIINNDSGGLVDLGGGTQNRLVDINPDDIERVEVLKGAAASAIYGSLASNGVVQFFTKRGKSGEPKISYSTSVNTNSIRETLPYNTAQLKWEDDGSGNLIAVPATRYNYQDYIFTTSTGNENKLSINGGNDKTKYAVSLSQYYNEGIVRNTDFSRKSVRLRLDQELYKWLDLSVGSYFSGSKSNDIPNGIIWNTGVLTSLLFADNLNDATPDENGNYPSIGWMANPNEAIDKIQASQEYRRSISDIQFKARPYKNLSVNYLFGIDNSNGEGLLYVPKGFQSKLNGASENSTSKTSQYNSDLNASYTATISDDLKSTTGIGYSYLYKKNTYLSMKNNQVGPIPGVIVVSPDVVSGGIDYRSEYSVWGGFLQQTFDYKNQLFVTFAGRIDGSSLFGLDERQQFYPKLSASYNISDANFWKENNYISSLKLRSAWGQTGGLTAIKNYSLVSNYNATSYGTIGYFPSSLKGNPNVAPERQTEFEVGFDMTLLKNRASIELTYYSQNVDDLLLERDLSPSTGYSKMFDNVGTMTNKGIEIALKATPIKGNFQWNFSSTFSKNTNNITHVEGGKMDVAPSSAGFWGTSVAITDHPLGVFYGSFIARDSNGKPVLDANGSYQAALGHYEEITLSDGEPYNVAVQDFDSNGQPEGELLKKVIGDPNPDFIASFTNAFKYKKFGFRFQIDVSQGNDVLSWDKRMAYKYPGGEFTGVELSDANKPQGFYSPNFGIYETFVEDGSYVKLREVALSYDLKLKKSYLDNVQFYLSGTNLISWDNHWGFDPEINTGGQRNGVLGQQMATVPIPRTFKLGAKFNF